MLLLILLIGVDAAFIAVHLVYTHTPFLADPLYSLERDRGYPELFQYIKFYWLVLLCLLLAWRRARGPLEPRQGSSAASRALTYVAWAMLFGVLLIADAFLLHETYGWRLARTLSLPPLLGLRAGDLGELIVMGAIGAVVLAALAVAYVGADEQERRFSRYLLALLGVLVFFAVVVDGAGSIMRDTGAGLVLHTLEDAGEMVIVSLMLSVVFMHADAMFGRGARQYLPFAGRLRARPAGFTPVPRDRA